MRSRQKIKTTVIIIAAVLVLLFILKEDNPTFIKIIGGDINTIGKNVILTDDNGYLIIGSKATSKKGRAGIYFLWLDEYGEKVKEKYFENKIYKSARDIKKTKDGNFIVVGSMRNEEAKVSNVLLTKIDANGEVLWMKTYGGEKKLSGKSVNQTADGGYVLFCRYTPPGLKHFDFYIIRVDESGNLLWENSFGDVGRDRPQDILETSAGEFIMYGRTSSYGEGMSDFYLVKMDKDGNLLWEKTIGHSYDEYIHLLLEADDGTYIAFGWTESSGAHESDCYLLNIDKSGDVIWEKDLGNSFYDRGFGIDKTSDGGYILLGILHEQEESTLIDDLGYNVERQSRAEVNQNLYLVKVDKDGNKEWSMVYGEDGIEKPYMVKQTPDGGYIVLGKTKSPETKTVNIYLIKTDKDGFVNIW